LNPVDELAEFVRAVVLGAQRVVLLAAHALGDAGQPADRRRDERLQARGEQEHQQQRAEHDRADDPREAPQPLGGRAQVGLHVHGAQPLAVAHHRLVQAQRAARELVRGAARGAAGGGRRHRRRAHAGAPVLREHRPIGPEDGRALDVRLRLQRGEHVVARAGHVERERGGAVDADPAGERPEVVDRRAAERHPVDRHERGARHEERRGRGDEDDRLELAPDRPPGGTALSRPAAHGGAPTAGPPARRPAAAAAPHRTIRTMRSRLASKSRPAERDAARLMRICGRSCCTPMPTAIPGRRTRGPPWW
jgi:hypothetical protein